MLFDKKTKHLFFVLFLMHNGIASERFYLLESNALWIKTSMDKNDQPISGCFRTVARYFKNKLPALPFFQSYLIICDQKKNKNQERYQHLVWCVQKIEKAIKINSEYGKKIYADQENLEKFQRLRCFLYNHKVWVHIEKSVCFLLANFLDEYKKKYLKDILLTSSIEECKFYKESVIQIDGFLNFEAKQERKLDFILREADKIIQNNVGNFKHQYIVESFDSLMRTYKVNIDSECTFDITNQLDSIRNDENYLSEFVRMWGDIFRKSLPFMLCDNILLNGTLENAINFINESTPNVNKVLKKIADLNYNYFRNEDEIFGNLFKDITQIPVKNKEFYIELKRNLLNVVAEKKIDNFEAIDKFKGIDNFEGLKEILTRDDSVITKDQVSRIKKQLLNVRSYLFLDSLKKYKCPHYNFLRSYWNEIPERYKKVIKCENNIRRSSPLENNIFSFSNIFIFIQDVERYKCYLLKDHLQFGDYTIYLNELIYPMLNYLYCESPLLKKLSNYSTLEKLYTLIKWEKNSFTIIKAEYYIHELNEEIKKCFEPKHASVVFNSKEYQQITAMMQKKESYVRDWDFCYEQSNFKKAKQAIKNYVEILHFMKKEKICDQIIVNNQQNISLVEHMNTLFTTYIVPYFDEYKKLKLENSETYFSDSNLLIQHIKKIANEIALFLLEKNFNEIHTWCGIRKCILNKYVELDTLPLIGMNTGNEKIIVTIIDLIKNKLNQLCDALSKDNYLKNLAQTGSIKNEVKLALDNLACLNIDRMWQDAQEIFDTCINSLSNLLFTDLYNDNGGITENYLSIMIHYKIFSSNTLLWILAKRCNGICSYASLDFIRSVIAIFVDVLIKNLQEADIASWFKLDRQKRRSFILFKDLQTCHRYIKGIRDDFSRKCCPDAFENIVELYEVCILRAPSLAIILDEIDIS